MSWCFGFVGFGGLDDDAADSLAGMIEEAGAHVRREAFIKTFCTKATDAWLDIWAYGSASIQDLLVDVTIRHPMSDRYQPAAARVPAAAANAAAEEKRERYPPRSGRQVVPFAMETWGRLDAEAESLLQQLAAAATLHARRRGQAATAGAFLRRWRAILDACLQRSMAASLTAARLGLPGKPFQRRRR